MGAHRRQQGTRSPSRWFLVLFVLYLIVGNLLMSVPSVDAWVIVPWTKLNTALAARLAGLAGLPATARGTVLSTGGAALDVQQGCNGFHALLIFVCAVLSCPASWATRLSGVVAGAAVILGFNLVRLVNLLAVARFFPRYLEVFHVYVWQTLIVILAVATFLGWGLLIARGKNETADPAAA